MGILILTGMSGGGKTQAAKFLEDIGYFCIDNMPLKLFSKFSLICAVTKSLKVSACSK